jgi:hypothetical protein
VPTDTEKILMITRAVGLSFNLRDPGEAFLIDMLKRGRLYEF